MGALWPAAYVEGLLASALLWTAALVIYAVRYAPSLWRPRLDGRPG